MVKESMLFELTHPLPEKVAVAVSGGVDSMSALHWLHRGKKVAHVLHINHGTPHAAAAQELVSSWCKARGVPFSVRSITEPVPDGYSKEDYWREFRYRMFHDYDGYVVTAHTLNDCLEELVFSTFVRGYPAVISYSNKNVIRPFRMWSRSSIMDYAKRHAIVYIDDPSNKDLNFKRNYIRHIIVPRIKELNPGIYKNVRTYIWRAKS
jgi:tRNA(Ile)-lysidine synthase